MKTYADFLGRYTREGELYETLPGGKLRCHACGHLCLIPEGHDGVCRVRFNRGGKLLVPFGYTADVHVDPVEKKPFFHAWPGSRALSFGMLGCDFHCSYCQNWMTSQALRDPASFVPPQMTTAEEIAGAAERSGSRMVVSTYNEPLITSEWAVEVFRLARARGFATAYVSNGNATRQVLEYLRPWVDLYKVDLKSFDDRHYRQLGGKLDTVLATLGMLVEMGFWLEVVTLTVPGFNDSDDELRRMAQFLASLSPDIPWHVTAFHQDYKMTDPENTPAATLVRAAEIGKAEGLRYVYAGNLPGRLGHWENTCCPGCGELLVERVGFRVLQNRLAAGGLCPGCARVIPGRWN
jgi:pyruvate formate lyase activating enzyme